MTGNEEILQIPPTLKNREEVLKRIDDWRERYETQLSKQADSDPPRFVQVQGTNVEAGHVDDMLYDTQAIVQPSISQIVSPHKSI